MMVHSTTAPAMTRKPSKRRPSRKPAARARARSNLSRSANAVADASGKDAKAARRVKVVRDSFTMPAADYERIGALKKRSLALGQEKKKSEVLRAGLRALEALADGDFVRLMASVEPVKTGRPPGGRKKDKRRTRSGK
jgi:hypothetical protein